MKKIFLISFLSSLLISSLYADKKTYLGIEYANAVTKFDASGNYEGSPTDNYEEFKFVLGKGIGDNTFIQLYLSSGEYDSNFGAENAGLILDDRKFKELGFEWMKKAHFEDNIYPFAKVGLGISTLKLNRQITRTDNATALSLTLGTGLDFNILDNLSLITGIDYNYKKWDSFKIRDFSTGEDNQLKLSQNSLKFYIGANLKF
ncbi:outer membrane protein [Aliarcobacter skirrowii]|uniref:outer membrane protein n=1 Tax=Aliarcobacter skirrowii TaxID=28200 RepID=UPI0029A405CE|nr:outer membrane beta-barrel protein [Aliarcobacter skirrowii]MDX4035484.1 outer membrane beta-barrel protein [Aliarcobacter skirrowii]